MPLTNAELQTYFLLLTLLPEAIIENMLPPLVPYMVRTLSSDLTPNRLESEIGARAGLFMSAFYLPLLVMNVTWGLISDRIGRKPVLLLGLFVCGATTWILGINTTSFAVAVLCRFLAGTFGGNSAVAKGTLGELHSTDKGRSWAYALYGQIYAISGICGPLLGGFLVSAARAADAQGSPYFTAFAFVAALSVISFTVASKYLEEPVNGGTSKPTADVIREDSGVNIEDDVHERVAAKADKFTVLSWKVCLPILLYVLIAFCNMYWGTILPLLFSSKPELGGLGLSAMDTSFAISIRACSKLLSSIFLSQRVVSRLGPIGAYILGMLIIIPASFILALLHGLEGIPLWLGVAVSMAMFGFVESQVYLSTMMLISASVPPSFLGAAFGFSSTCAALVRTLAPPLSGIGWEMASTGGYGSWVAFVALQAIALLSILVALVGASGGVRAQVPRLRMPTKRRTETGALLVFMCLVPVCVAVFAEMLLRAYITRLIALVYLLYILQDKGHEEGARCSEWVRSWKVWEHLRDFFPISLRAEAILDPSKNYIFCYHPHGIVSMGAFSCFATEACKLSNALPGLNIRLLTLETNFKIPFWRDLLLALNVASVDKRSIQWVLGKPHAQPGDSVMIVPGGAAEALESQPNTNRLLIRTRKGFVRQALHHGASLVPVFGFGETDVWDQVLNPEGSCLRQVQTAFKNVASFSPVLFHGRGLFTRDFGMLPYRRPIVVVVGSPIDIPHLPDAPPEVVEKFHARYMEALKALYDRHKEELLPERHEDLLFL
ncbi:diacylglycerol acyltransferase-domain-containing protein [Chytriomyces sp. MP71]|nr:diacylglycerol acyltransferase-domain-containing protein [Chytriomyces sp. MP71]